MIDAHLAGNRKDTRSVLSVRLDVANALRSVGLGLLALLIFASSAAAQAPAQPAAEKNPLADKTEPELVNLEKLLKNNEEVRVNGARLQIQPAHFLDDRTDRLIVHWEIDYTGPRWPFTILEPSLKRVTYGQTGLTILATGKYGKTYAMEFRSSYGTDPFAVLPTKSKKRWFVTKEKGFIADGDFKIPTGDVKRYFTTGRPSDFDRVTTDRKRRPRLYFQMWHKPGDRGEHLKLDAWTGELRSTVVELFLDEW